MYRKTILVFLILINISFSKTLEIFFLDVGEGESILITTPDKKNIMIDTGNIITGNKALNFLKSKGIKKIDRLIITHPHPDHSGGVFTIAQNIQVLNKHDNGQPIEINNCIDFYRWYSEFFRTKNYKPLKKGDILYYKDTVIEILSPEKLTDDWNESSLVILIKHNKVRILLMGDGNMKTEKFLMKTYRNLSANLLKVGHHGADDVLSDGFLEMVKPEYAVISINKNNIRGYPSERVIKQIKDSGIKLLTTYKHGTVHFKSDGEKIWLVQ
ncbi:ComEC/Rec2 family competence protein [Persephonella sp.]